jgi:hypothetical protein
MTGDLDEFVPAAAASPAHGRGWTSTRNSPGPAEVVGQLRGFRRRSQVQD